MAENERNEIIPLPAGGLTNIGYGPKSILATIVSDAMGLLRQRELEAVAPRYRIGEYVFRAPDYSQVLIWSKSLGLEPEDFINEAAADMGEKYGFAVEDGSIVRITLNQYRYGMPSLEWVDGLRIKNLRLSFFDHMHSLRLPLPSLTSLDCSCIWMTELELSGTPNLTHLDCSGNELTELDLTKVPELVELECRSNKLSDLDLSGSSGLKTLVFEGNVLAIIDLSHTPGLTALGSYGNRLTELDLSAVPGLRTLGCGGNQLTELDLTAVPGLRSLGCSGNQLAELDFSCLPELETAWCDHNNFTELDIRHLGKLKNFSSDTSVFIKKLHTQDLTALRPEPIILDG